MKNLAVFASGRGSNFHAIVEHVRMRILQNVNVQLLVTNDANALAVSYAQQNSIPSEFIQGLVERRFATKVDREIARNKFDEDAVDILHHNGIDFVALAGFTQVLGPTLVDNYRWKIINVHPAKDLMRFGGRGMIGDRVHAAVIKAGEKESGCTIHYVDNSIDGGPMIIQGIVPVEPTDTPEVLRKRILIQEHRTYSKAIQLHVDGRVSVVDHKAVIDWSGDWEEQWDRRQEPFVRSQMPISAA
jgi:phosphoribosylglycinamide formyltransferase-1